MNDGSDQCRQHMESIRALRSRCDGMRSHLAEWQPAVVVENGGCSWTEGGVTRVWPMSKGEKRPIEGLRKLDAAIRSEVKFLDRLLAHPASIRKTHVTSSNVPQLDAIIRTLRTERDPVAVLKSFTYSDPCPKCQSGERDSVTFCTCSPAERAPREHTVKVDVVSERGLRWLKVRARNERGIELEFLEDQHYESDDSDDDEFDDDSDDGDSISASHEGLQTLVESTRTRDHFAQYSKAALANPSNLQVPKMIMRFCKVDEINPQVSQLLEDAGLLVEVGFPDQENLSQRSNPPLTETLNLDGSTLIALVSDLSHTRTMSQGAAGFPAFAAQLKCERETPLLEDLVEMLRGHRLIASQLAVDHFREIVRLLAGPDERLRALYLLPNILAAEGVSEPLPDPRSSEGHVVGPLRHLEPIEVVPNTLSKRISDLQHLLEHRKEGATREGTPVRGNAKKAAVTYVNGRRPGKLKWMHAQVFGTGDNLDATTITANLSVVRSIQELGVALSVWVHQPRSLTQSKSIRFPEAPPTNRMGPRIPEWGPRLPEWGPKKKDDEEGTN